VRKLCIPLSALALALPAAAAAQRSEPSEAVILATREYQRTGVARTVKTSRYLAFPYGHSQPQLTCAALRACTIELQAGEEMLGVDMGDTERWSVGSMPGPNGTLLVVKPRDCDVSTNLILSTNRRIYHLLLDAPPCRKGANPQSEYTRHVRFYYPDEVGVQLGRQGPTFASDPTQFNWNYKVENRRFPWRPVQVFDDGQRTYIRFPSSARNAEAPVLYVLRPDGKSDVLNYSVQSDYYIADRVLQRAALVVGGGRNQRRLEITNRGGGQ
jgi:type IV secretion system protein VirB9